MSEKDNTSYSRVGPIIKPIVPTSNPNYYKIGEEASGEYFYRYMGLNVAISSIEDSTIRFVEPCTWEDKFESHFYMAKIFGKKNTSDNPFTYAYCVTNKKNNEAAWKLYTHDAIGLAARCVQFKFKQEDFRNKLLEVIGNKYDLYEGVVQYVSEEDLRALHLSKVKCGNKYIDNFLYHRFFDNFKLENYLNLLLLKRNAFEHEKEVRFFLIPKNASQQEKGDNLKEELEDFDWSNIIEEVAVDNNCTELELRILRDILSTKNIKFDKYYTYGSDFDAREIYVKKPLGEPKDFVVACDCFIEIYNNSILVYKHVGNYKVRAALRDCAYDMGFQFDIKKENTQSLGWKLLKEYCGGESSGNIGKYHIERADDGHIDVYQIVENMKKELRTTAEKIGINFDKDWTTNQAGMKIVDYIKKFPIK